MIEADLRRPVLGNLFGVQDQAAGVVSVLIENITLDQALVPTPLYGTNLRLLTADYEGGWIAELFSIPAAVRMVEEARNLAGTTWSSTLRRCPKSSMPFRLPATPMTSYSSCGWGELI